MGKLAERLKQLPQGSRVYKLKALPKLLADAVQVDRLYILLTDFDFIEAKISELGPQPLIEDYDLAFTPDILNSGEWLKSKGENLRIIQSALRLSAHILEQDKTRLTAQLLGRLSPLEASEIKPLLEQAAKQCQLDTKLRPLTPSLTQPSNRLVRTLVGHTRTVTDVVVTPDGQHAISASVDQTLRIWNLKTGEMLQTLENTTREMTAIAAKSGIAIAITSNGCRAISASANAVSVWNLKNMTQERTFQEDATSNGRSVAITPDGKLIISAFSVYALKIWNCETGAIFRILQGHSSWLGRIVLTPDGQKVISTSADRTLIIWDLQTGEILHTLEGHTREVTAVAITPDGEKVISGSTDCTIKVWELQTGKILHTLECYTGEITAVAVTPNGKQVISASDSSGIITDAVFKVWDVEYGVELYSFKDSANRVTAIAITPDGKQIISASTDKTLKVWNLAYEAEQLTLQGHTAWVKDIVITPDGKQAISTSLDNTFKVWDLETGAERFPPIRHSGEITTVVITPNGKQAISTSTDNTLKIWALETGKVQHTCNDRTGIVLAVAPDSQQAISAEKNILKVWDLKSGKICRTFTDHTDTVFSATVTRDNRQVFSTSRDALKIWDLETGEVHHTFNRDNTNVLSVTVTTTDKKQVIFASSDNTLEVWTLNGEGNPSTFKGSTDWVRAVAVTPDGEWAICASQAIIEVWNLKIGVKLHTLQGHTDVRAVAVTLDGQRAISVSEDVLKVWEVKSGRVIDYFIGDAPLWSCAMTSDGRIIAVGELSGRVHFLRLEGM